MLSLLLLALAVIAASAVVTVARPAGPLPVEATIPVAAFGLTWRRHRFVQTGRGPRTLWLGEGDTDRYSRAYKISRDVLRDVGYSWVKTERSGGPAQPVCWEDPAASEAALDVALATAEEARLGVVMTDGDAGEGFGDHARAANIYRPSVTTCHDTGCKNADRGGVRIDPGIADIRPAMS